MVGGLETPGGVTTSLTEIGQGRKMVVDISLKRACDSVTGQSNVDPKGYLTDLGHIKISTDAEIGDIKRARTLLKSVVNTNPNNAPGWVAAARLVRFCQAKEYTFDGKLCFHAAIILPPAYVDSACRRSQQGPFLKASTGSADCLLINLNNKS